MAALILLSLLESLRILDSSLGKSFEDLMMKKFGLSVSSSGSHGFWLLAYFGHCKFGLSVDSLVSASILYWWPFGFS